MNGNEIKEATFEDALYCAKALVGVERCEECRFYTLGDLWCDDTYRIMHEALEEIKEYRAIGTVEDFKALKEKNEPKEPDYQGDGCWGGHVVIDTWICPSCGKHYEFDYDDYDYCPNCGQHIDHSGLTEDD